jgi:dTDP-4-amino-4,6-dideoxygalactose transaminase
MAETKIIPFTDLKSQYIEAKAEIDLAIMDTIRRSSFITGSDVTRFEETIATYTDAEDCASTGSGTTALQVALKAAGIKPGDEVITVSLTFVSTVEAIVNVGAIPVMIDIDEYYQMDVNLIEEAITSKTKAILYVDMYGQTPDVNMLKKIAYINGLILIADAAHSFGSSYKCQRVGSLVDLTCVSFNPVKNLGAMGDAGCVLGSKYFMDRARMYRDHGRNQKFVFEKVGYNARIDNMQANIILAKLPYLDNWVIRKRAIAANYSQQLKDIVCTPLEHPDSYHAYYVYVIATDRRSDLAEYLKEAGIQTNIHYPIGCHLQPAFKEYYRPLPATEAASNTILSLPCYPSLTADNQEYIIDKIKEFFK